MDEEQRLPKPARIPFYPVTPDMPPEGLECLVIGADGSTEVAERFDWGDRDNWWNRESGLRKGPFEWWAPLPEKA